MDNKLEKIVQALQEKFKTQAEEFRGEAHVFAGAEQIVDVLTFLRDQQGFELLSAMTAVDYWPQVSPRFHVIYQLTSVANNLSLMVRVPVSGDQPEVPTASGVYAASNWREREIWDMFGVRFAGHPDLRRIMMPPGWQGHPLLKENPVKVEEVAFSFNRERIDADKPYAQE